MKAYNAPDGYVMVELTRRNLQALLAKLDGNPPNSACTLFTPSSSDVAVAVRAVENEVHYADRRPGPLHADTEAKLA